MLRVSKDVGYKDYSTWARGRGSRLRLPRYPRGYRVHVVLGTQGQRPVFEATAVADDVFEAVKKRRGTLAVCLMPDHMHWVLNESSGLIAEVQRVKAWTTRTAWAAGFQGKLWQRSFFDTLLSDEREVRAALKYIESNPVRAGIAAAVGEYPWVFGCSGERVE